MAGRPISRLRATQSLSVQGVEDEATQRALDQVQGAVQTLQARRERVAIVADLIVGTNVLRHGLGRAVVGYTLTPTVADATFAHAIDLTNTNPGSELWITVIGVAQPGARVEAW